MRCKMALPLCYAAFCCVLLDFVAEARHEVFVSTIRKSFQHTNKKHLLRMSSSSTPIRLSPKEKARRKSLLENSKDGPFFALNQFSGNIEFGATANLVTSLESKATPNAQKIAQWLSDERRIAMSIWDKDLMKEKPNNVFELKVMTLQFVTIQLAPSVDLKMWTANNSNGTPQFLLHSIGFEPNISLLPGGIGGISAKDLGICIEVVGELQPTPDGTGLIGKITFRSSGNLPPPMRLLPPVILKTATDSINDTITKFAIKSFQTGARQNYQDFVPMENGNSE